MTDGKLLVLVEDDEALRAAVVFQLAAQDWAVASFASAEALLDHGMPAHATAALIDVRLGPGMDGVALTATLREASRHVPIIVMTGHGDVPLAVRAMQAGAVNFIEKPFDADKILAALAEAAARDNTALHDSRHQARTVVAKLSPRERQVLTGLVAGKSNKALAGDLGLSPRTVEEYRATVMGKLGAQALAEAVRIGLEAGL